MDGWGKGGREGGIGGREGGRKRGRKEKDRKRQGGKHIEASWRKRGGERKTGEGRTKGRRLDTLFLLCACICSTNITFGIQVGLDGK